MSEPSDDADGPPMVPHETNCSRRLKRKRRKVLPQNIPWKKTYKPRAFLDLQGADHMIASELPEGFPEDLAFRALAAYAFLRTLSRELRLSPFTPNVFLRALNLPYPSRLIGRVHVALLRHLLPTLGYTYRPQGMSLTKKRTVDGLRWDLRAGDNLTYLDSYTWPLFYDDYVHLTADILYERLHDNASHLDYRVVALQDENGDYIPSSDLEEANDEVDRGAVEISSPKVARGRGFGLPIRGGRRMPIARTQIDVSTRPTTKSTIPPFQPRPKRRKLEEVPDSESDASFQSDETDTDDEDFNAPRSRGKGTGRRGRPRKRPTLPSNPTTLQPVRQTHHTSGIGLSSGMKLSDSAPMKCALADPYRPLGPQTLPIVTPAPGTLGSHMRPPIAGIDRQLASNYQTFARPIQAAASGLHTNWTGPQIGIQSSNAEFACGPHIERPPPPGIPRPGVPYGGMPRPGVPYGGAAHVWHQPAAAYLGRAVSEAACDSRCEMQIPRPWMRRPMMTQLPRPGMPSILSEMPPRPRVSAPPVPQMRLEKVKPKGLCVSDTVADALENFLSSREPPRDSQPENDSHRESSSSKSSPPFDPWKSNTSQDKWPQFAPLQEMRQGIPHHRLPISQKIDVLEFLIDELLTVDYIAAEFTRRQVMTSCYSQRFGSLPTKQELDVLENEDECGVCGFEGDLLCCDGCPSSYHKECIGMHDMSQLPEGTWLCPECQIVDPALFGSLRGGRKASVDWFCVKDLHTTDRSENGQNLTSRAGNHDQNCARSSPMFLPSSNGSEKVVNEGVSHDNNQEDALMIVHGFVFRQRNSRSDLGLLDELRNESISYNIVKPAALFPFLQPLGMALISRWPFVQIPMDTSKVWNSPVPQTTIKSIATFFAKEQSYDPSKYQSFYNLAPLPKALNAGAPIKDVALVTKDYEHFCYHADTKMLSLQLKADASSDKSLSLALRCETSLFSPYSMIVGYLQKLEGALSRAGLLSEFWCLRSKNGGQDKWIRNVAHCRSIMRLAKLLVTLVDAVHPLAFNDDWFESPTARSGRGTRHDTHGDDKRVYRPLPVDWTAEKEKAARKWEQCTESNMLSLLAADSKGLGEFVDGTRAKIIGKKRKGNKSSSTMSEHPSTTGGRASDAAESTTPDYNISCISQGLQTSQKPEGHEHVSQESMDSTPNVLSKDLPCNNTDSAVEETLLTGVTSPEDAARSLRSRRQSREGVDGINGKQGDGGIDGTLNQARDSKIKDFVATLAHPIEKEIHWPVCGRYFFDPVAYIAPSEMKRLGRNAGTVVAPYVTYSKSYEVGQGGACHIWRKRSLDCISFESLILQIRALQSFLDDDVIFSCETAMRRYGGNKASLQKSIVSSLRDLSSGELSHFVYHPGRHRGCWMAASKIDVASYVVEREKRKAKIRAERERKALDEKLRLHTAAKKGAITKEAAAPAAAALVKDYKPSAAVVRPRERASAGEAGTRTSSVPLQRIVPQTQNKAATSSITLQRFTGDSNGKGSGMPASGGFQPRAEPYIQSSTTSQTQNRAATSSIALQRFAGISNGKGSGMPVSGGFHPRAEPYIQYSTTSQTQNRAATSSIALQRFAGDSDGKGSGMPASGGILPSEEPSIQYSPASQTQNETATSAENRQRGIQKLQIDLESTLMKHKADTGRLLLECMSSGLNSIPEQAMFDLRSRHLAQLRNASTQIGRLAGPNLSDAQLKALMIDTEGLARQSFQHKIATARIGDRGGFEAQRLQQPHSQYAVPFQQMHPHAHAPQQYSQSPAAYPSHSHSIDHSHHVTYPQQDNFAHNLRAHTQSSAGVAFSNPNQMFFPTEPTYQLGMPQPHPQFAPPMYGVADHHGYGLFGQQPPPGFGNDPSRSMQSQSLHQPNQQHFELAHGNNMQHLQPQFHSQQRHFEPTTELDFDPSSLDDLSHLDPRQWT